MQTFFVELKILLWCQDVAMYWFCFSRFERQYGQKS